MLRREFLARAVTGFAPAAVSVGTASAYTKKKHRAASRAERPNAKLERIAISTWSLRNYFRGTRARDFSLPGPLLALLDFPDLIVDRYKVHHLELSAAHFPSTEPTYLKELKYTLSHARSTIVNIPVDIDECGPDGTFSDPDPEKRTAALEAVKSWVDVAHDLGVKCVRAGPGKVDGDDLERTAQAYKALAAYAKHKGVKIMVENQRGFGEEDPAELESLLQMAGRGNIAALPNLANFSDEATRREGLALLFPYAHAVCHAKTLKFDAAGAELTYDFPEALALAEKAKYLGVYSIEFDGAGDPYAGIQKTLDELLKYL